MILIELARLKIQGKRGDITVTEQVVIVILTIILLGILGFALKEKIGGLFK